MTETSSALLRQEAALVWHEAAELEVRTDNNWLVRSDPDAERHVSNAIEAWPSGHRHDPVEIPRVGWRKSYRASAGFTRVGCGRG